jgi:hypothetical protein
MKLLHITQNCCPVCKESFVVNESIEVDSYNKPAKIRHHTNGQQWETRKFLCGCVISHIPNFSCSYVTSECSYAPDLKDLEKLRREIRGKIALLEIDLIATNASFVHRKV